MKINSHLFGFGLVGVLLVGWWLLADKVVGSYKGYTIIKRKNVYLVERMPGDRDKSPLFASLEAVYSWIDAQVVQSTVSNLATALPWSY